MEWWCKVTILYYTKWEYKEFYTARALSLVELRLRESKVDNFCEKPVHFFSKTGNFRREVHPFPFPHPRLRRKHQAERMKFAHQRVRIK